jgi:hypothetical protein
MVERYLYKTGMPLTSHDRRGRAIDPALYYAKITTAQMTSVNLFVRNKRVNQEDFER